MTYKTNIRRLWTLDGRRQTGRGPQDLRNDTVVRALVFLLPHISQTWSEEAGSPETLIGKDKKKSSTKTCSPLPKKQGRGHQARQKIFRNNCSTWAKHPRKNYGPSPTNNNIVQVGRPHLLPSWGYDEVPQLLGWYQKRPNRDRRLSFPPAGNEAQVVSVGIRWESWTSMPTGK